MEKNYQPTLHPLPSGYAEVIKRKKNCFYVVFDDDPKHKFCISYSDTLIEDEIFLNKDLKDLRLKENE